jgi:prepilin-type N-terminal cleavage/methylation domain-containing protein
MKKSGTFKINESGFTLVEILVSLVIILILVIAFAPMFELIAKTISSNKARDTATALANSTLEEMRSLPFIVLDPVTGEIEDDPNTPQLGTYSGDLINYTPGNPPGSIKQIDTKTISNVTYTIKTLISWDATLSYKKVSVIVEAPSAFNGSVKATSKFYTLAAEEGERVLPASGFILVKIKDKDGNILTSPEILVKIEAQSGIALTQEDYAENGEKLFGMLRAGEYTVSAKVSNDMTYSPDQVFIGGWIAQADIEVNDGNATEVTFYIDYPGKISLELKDDTSDQAIIGNGTVELSWTDGSNSLIMPSVDFKSNDFVNGRLKPSIIGNLWPGGEYVIKLTDVLDGTTLHAFKPYDPTAAGTPKPKKNGSSDWNGSFEIANSTINITIEFSSPQNSLLKTHLADMVETNTLENNPADPDDDIEVIATWKDQSGNNHDAIPLDSNRPVFITNVVSGQPVIRFSGDDHQRLKISDGALCTDNFTIFVVAKTEKEHGIDGQSTFGTDGYDGQQYLFWPDKLTDFNAGQGLSLGSNGVSNYEHGEDYMPATAVYSGSLSNFNLITVKYEHKRPFIYINGDTAYPTEGDESPRDTVSSSLIIGGGQYGYFTGDIAEILIYDTPLNNANIELVSSVLKEKYQLP